MEKAKRGGSNARQGKTKQRKARQNQGSKAKPRRKQGGKVNCVKIGGLISKKDLCKTFDRPKRIKRVKTCENKELRNTTSGQDEARQSGRRIPRLLDLGAS